MSDYTQITDFSVKDGLTTGDPEKKILGADVDAELAAIATAIQSKYDSDDISSEAVAEALASNAVLLTPLQLANVLQDNAGMAYDIQQLADPGTDTLLGWDDSASAARGFTPGTGISISGTQVVTNDAQIVHDDLSGFVGNEHINHASVTLTAGSGLSGGGTIAASRTFSVNTGGGLEVNGSDQVALAASVAGDGLDLSSGVLSVDMTDVDMSSIPEDNIQSITVSQDGWLFTDNGDIHIMPYNDGGIRVASNVTGTTDTLAGADANTLIPYTNGSAIAVTLNNGSGIAKGAYVVLLQLGAGQITVSGTATINGAIGLKTREQYSAIVLMCVDTNTFVVMGDAAA